MDIPCIFPAVKFGFLFNPKVTVSGNIRVRNDFSIVTSRHTVGLADELIWWIIRIVSPQRKHDVVCTCGLIR